MANAAQPAASPILLESREGAVLTLTLNRPERLNALNPALSTALVDALRRAADDSVRCVVITGAGRAFCSGGDVAMMHEARRRNAARELETMLRAGHELVLVIRDLPKPVVAAVNGPATGAGANVALACDIRIASEHASFGQNFARVGLFPDFGGTYLLPRLVGPSVATELLMTGEMVSAAQAHRLGLVNRVVPAEKLAEETRATAERLLAAPPLVVRAIKQALFGPDRAALDRALQFEVEKQLECFHSEDAVEGLSAFLEKRKPDFKGR